MKKCCLSCDNARDIAEVNLKEGLVGCAYHSVEGLKGNKSSFQDINGDIYEGWVWLKRLPYVKGQTGLGQGIRTNFCIIVQQKGFCGHFKQMNAETYQRVIQAKNESGKNG